MTDFLVRCVFFKPRKRHASYARLAPELLEMQYGSAQCQPNLLNSVLCKSRKQALPGGNPESWIAAAIIIHEIHLNSAAITKLLMKTLQQLCQALHLLAHRVTTER